MPVRRSTRKRVAAAAHRLERRHCEAVVATRDVEAAAEGEGLGVPTVAPRSRQAVVCRLLVTNVLVPDRRCRGWCRAGRRSYSCKRSRSHPAPDGRSRGDATKDVAVMVAPVPR